MFTTITDSRELFPTDRNGHVWQFSANGHDFARHCARCGRIEVPLDDDSDWCVFIDGDGHCAAFADPQDKDGAR